MSEADFTFVLHGIRDAIQKKDTTCQVENFPPKVRKLLPFYILVLIVSFKLTLLFWLLYNATLILLLKHTHIHFLTHTFTKTPTYPYV